MKTLLIDNYDSFTYNLFHLIATVTGVDPVVIHNDDWDRWAEVDLEAFDAVVISPGPGRPDRFADFGISRSALDSDVPVLGVCLGHQGMCMAEGAPVVRAPEPVHGRTSAVEHDGTGLFEGVPSPFTVVRYHSLLVRDVPSSLEVTATTTAPGDGTELVMAVRHRTRAQWGVQFHPESILTSYGFRMIENFCHLARQHRAATRPASDVEPSSTNSADPFGRDLSAESVSPLPAHQEATPALDGPSGSELENSTYRLSVRRLEVEPDCSELFEHLFAGQRNSFWLDSSSVGAQGSKLSILGAMGPCGEWVTADAGTGNVLVEHADGSRQRVMTDMFEYLRSQTAARAAYVPYLPFDFALGYVGYFGYEMKADCGGDLAHVSDLPDAGFVFCDRAVVVDHETTETWLLALVTPSTAEETSKWQDHAGSVVAQSAMMTPHGPTPTDREINLPVTYRHSPERYEQLVRECLEEIRAGESYEICLTNALSVDVDVDPLDTYRELRRISPVPYGAFLNFPDAAVLSASPECFLQISADGHVQTRPIKGTRPRGRNPKEDRDLVLDLATCEKDRAENLMIVDLLRNDLGSVAEVGSVRVAELFSVHSFATVHQLVSTVEAQLRPAVSAVDCLRAAFPGGSMTGAPKRRTMQIIDRLEGGSRGIYSGALGYFSLSGAADFSIVIRTLVVQPGRVSVGAGGAVVMLSDPKEETDEMLLKAAAPLRAVRRAAARAEQARSSCRPPDETGADSVPRTGATYLLTTAEGL